MKSGNNQECSTQVVECDACGFEESKNVSVDTTDGWYTTDCGKCKALIVAEANGEATC